MPSSKFKPCFFTCLSLLLNSTINLVKFCSLVRLYSTKSLIAQKPKVLSSFLYILSSSAIIRSTPSSSTSLSISIDRTASFASPFKLTYTAGPVFFLSEYSIHQTLTSLFQFVYESPPSTSGLNTGGSLSEPAIFHLQS